MNSKMLSANGALGERAGTPPALHMPPKRVLMVLQSTAGGGMETMAADLAAEYARRGIALRTVAPTGPRFDELAQRAAAAGGVTRIDTDARAGRIAQLRAMRQFAGIVWGWKPDVVHLHTGGATGGLGVVALARLAGAGTVIVTEHDVPLEAPGRWQRSARRAMDQLAGTIVAVSRRNASLRTGRLAPPPRMASILNGVPLPAIEAGRQAANRSEIRAGYGIASDAVVIGSVVRLAGGKGLDDLLHAFASIGQPDLVLLLVGDGPLRGEMETLAGALGIGARVRFAGHQEDPGPFFDAMDVFVLPVPAGSMSIALLEAMARGLPPVITFGGPEEAVIDGKTGLTPPPHDPRALAGALEQVARDEELRARLGRAAAGHVAKNFTIARVADDYLDVYREARDGRVPHRLRFESRYRTDAEQ